MTSNPVPMAPAMAAAVPPPGVGSGLANASRNRAHVISANFIRPFSRV